MGKINEKKVEEKEEKPYPITISDWLVFLESNVTSNIALYVLIGSFLIALSISLIRLDNSITLISFFYSAVLIIFVVIVSAVWWKTSKPEPELKPEPKQPKPQPKKDKSTDTYIAKPSTDIEYNLTMQLANGTISEDTYKYAINNLKTKETQEVQHNTPIYS